MSGRSGVYFNVERTGAIQAGDNVSIVHRVNDSVSILEISKYVFAELAINQDRLQYILSRDGLSQTSALLLGNKLYQIIDQQQTQLNRWHGWREFRVDRVVDEALDIKSFVLEAVDGKEIAPYRAGQFLTVELQIDQAEPMIRVWSLSDFQTEPEHYRISIKREPKSLGGSAFMHQEIKPDDTVRIMPPMGSFVLDRSSFKPVLLLAGGIGITPLLAMARAHIDRGAKAPPLYFIHCCQNRERQPFREELDALAKLPGVKLLHVYDSPGENDRAGFEYDLQGYLTLPQVAEFMADCHIVHGGKKIAMPWFDCDIYICGPTIFQEKLVSAMLEDGANKARLFTESFSAGATAELDHTIQQTEVTFSSSNITVTWHADDKLTLLELAEANGLQPPNACRMGVCQSCSVTLLDGDITYLTSLTHEPADGQVLLCSAIPASKHITMKL
jgi:ferredoxin-NADP reductase